MIKKVSILLTLLLITSFKCNAQNWDINTLNKINEWEIHGASKVISNTTPIITIGLPSAMGIYALIEKDKPLLKKAIYIGTSVIEAVGISYVTKEIVDRERPFLKYPNKITPYGASGIKSSSFPSSHTAAAFSLATSLSITYPKWYVIAPSAIWATSVGIARMNQGVHYPSDVITGAVIGVGCGFLNIYANRWLNKVLFDE
ncbi:phosphatase PAP2 family protein [Phocaeicola paurosaccharolyticus]|uniref:phosphatase PAP2 family protein n=1 Tax=Phocaeicola paurosaccharolyticus TaxID=732242 RepID=UPI00046A15A3|nr:phosphatase PAP2 family protein [Phocaeicola paurosaccharolyticus]